MTMQVNGNQLDKLVLETTGTVLVEFSASWCELGAQMGRILDGIADQMKDKLTFARIDIHKHPEAMEKYGVRSIPTLILFRDGKAIETRVGCMPKSRLVEWLHPVTGDGGKQRQS